MPHRVRKLAEALPSPAGALLERSHSRYLGTRLRNTVDDDGLVDERGLPIPPPWLRHLVSGSDDPDLWLRTGEQDAELIARLLSDNGTPFDQLPVVLDFGCGSGRVARWWPARHDGPRLLGCDYDGLLIDWCRRHLSFIQVKVNASMPPLPFRRESVDCVYAISLFTHMTAGAQDAWIADVVRVLKPGGLFLFTVHGERFASRLDRAQLERFSAGERVVLGSELNGAEGCAAFHPPGYVHGELLKSAGLELIEHVDVDRAGAGIESPMALQDNYLTRKP